MLASGRHLLQLINDILDLSKVETGKMELHPETFPLGVAIAEVLAVVSPMVRRKSITIHHQIDGSDDLVSPGPSKVDTGSLQSTFQCGQIYRRRWGRTDQCRPHGPCSLRVRVRDTGIGISAQDIPRLFVEFRQLDASATRRHGGTGLGLALTKKIVEAQFGTVRVESELALGSTFTVILPFASAAPSAVPVAALLL